MIWSDYIPADISKMYEVEDHHHAAAILVTRSSTLESLFDEMGGEIKRKYGASTTHMNKLLPRLKAGRGGGCPILAFGITKQLVTD